MNISRKNRVKVIIRTKNIRLPREIRQNNLSKSNFSAIYRTFLRFFSNFSYFHLKSF